MNTFFDLENMILTIKHLSILLEKEIFMLKNMQLKEIETIQQEKITMSSLIEQYKDMITRNPLLLKNQPEEQLDQFEEIVINFEKILSQYTIQCNKSKASRDIIMDSIKKAFMKNNNKLNNYNSSGKNKDPIDNYTEPLSIDENI